MLELSLGRKQSKVDQSFKSRLALCEKSSMVSAFRTDVVSIQTNLLLSLEVLSVDVFQGGCTLSCPDGDTSAAEHLPGDA